ncbi:MAG: 6,7-dimethyl-8-ribityllumazine synthase [Planctomycetes bacterium]|nr:6,7-dimethyl-8-ribityllumazine synthase [Planctomycetota bacterium]
MGKPRPPRVALIASEFNAPFPERLLAGALGRLKASGVPASRIRVLRVPGAWEIPAVASACASCGAFDAVVALGCILRGGTNHDEVIAHAVARELQAIASRLGVPVGLGIVTARTLAQVRARCRPGPDNRGAHAAEAALRTVEVVRRVRSGKA